MSEANMNRRSFLKAMAATAATATAVGAGAGLLNRRLADVPPTISVSDPPAVPAWPTSPPIVVNPNAEAAELLARLTAVQAENVRLQAELDAAQRSLAALQQSGAERDDAAQQLRWQLSSTQNELGLMGGLLALYEQLDALGVDEAIEGGLTAVGDALSDLMSRVPTVGEGLAFGQEALNQVEAHLPRLEDGRNWLDRQLVLVDLYYRAVELALQTAVEKAGAFLTMLNEWFQSIARWLPFGMGRSAAQVMEALTVLLGETPNTVGGLQSHVKQPLDAWLGTAGSEAPLRRDIVRPLRDRALKPAADALDQAEAVHTTFENKLAAPTRTAVAHRQHLRDLIAEYRRQNGI